MLLLLLLASHAFASELRRQSNFVTRNIETCPSEGYFFRRELSTTLLPGPCYLCFCQANSSAICWPRDNNRCDVEHYHHHGVGKRDTRQRRSPVGLSDIFFRDATRQVFNRDTPEQCKPFESSYSDGCPPDDWCIGCTVCDCDANGRWDCHLLSFCPDKKTAKKKKDNRGPKGGYKSELYNKKMAEAKAKKKQKNNKATNNADPSARKYFYNANHLKSKSKVRIHDKNIPPPKKNIALPKKHAVAANKLSAPIKTSSQAKKNVIPLKHVPGKKHSSLIQKNASSLKKNAKQVTKSTKSVKKNTPSLKNNVLANKRKKPIIKPASTMKVSTTLNKRQVSKMGSKVMKNPMKKSPQHLNKAKPVKRNQLVAKRAMKKVTTPVKKALKPTKLPPGKKLQVKMSSVKKSAPLKKNTPKTSTSGKSRGNTKTMTHTKSDQTITKTKKAPSKNQIKRSPSKYLEISGVQKYSDESNLSQAKPVKSKHRKKVYDTKKSQIKPKYNITNEMAPDLAKTFMNAFKQVLSRSVERTLSKRSIPEDLNNSDDYLSFYKTRIKRQYSQFMSEDNKYRNWKESWKVMRNKRDVATERGITVNNTFYYYYVNNSTPLSQHNTTDPATTTSNNYYKYTIDNVTRDTTLPHFPRYSTLIQTLADNFTTSKSVDRNHIENFARDSVLKLIDNKSNATTHLVLEIVTERSASAMDAANDLKFNMWSELAAYRDKEQNTIMVNSNLTLNRTEKSVKNPSNMAKGYVKLDNKKKIYSSDVTRVGISRKKFKIKKVLKVINKTKKYDLTNLSTRTDLDKNKNKTKLNDLQSFFASVLSGLSNNSTNKSHKSNKSKIIRYLQKFITKIYAKSDNITLGKNKTSLTSKHNVVETICESFGPCHINRNNKMLIQSKINDLKRETNDMMRTIKTIKGLLSLLDFARNDRELKGEMSLPANKSNLRSDIKKLNSILKGTYMKEEKIVQLTETQKHQIDYIKKNTHNFIQCTGRFAKILTDIIDTLTNPAAYKITDIHSKTGRKRYTKPIRAKTTKSLTSSGYEKIKDLVSKYDTLQNKFVQKMHQMLRTYEANANSKDSQIENQNLLNKTAAIQVYTRNIIRNLRKLKSLAQALSSDTDIREYTVRKKRELREDDSMEYLLVLMEYLLKRNYPAEPIPENDGLDVLIEAIKNAPDIKPIKKKTIQIPHTYSVNFNKNKTQNGSTSLVENNSIDENNSVSYKISIENANSTQDDSKVIDESDLDLKFRKANNKVVPTLPTVDIEAQDPMIQAFKLGLKKYSKGQDASGSYTSIRSKNTDIYKTTTYNYNGEEESNDDVDVEKKLYIFSLDEDTSLSSTTTESSITKMNIMPTIQVESNETKEIEVDDNSKNIRIDDVVVTKNRDNNYLKWLDDSVDEDEEKDTNTSKTPRFLTTSTIAIERKSKINQVENESSSQTNESLEDKKKRVDEEELIYKKEMNLLNSLDYDDEKAESDVSESRDIIDDKYATGDASATYFS